MAGGNTTEEVSVKENPNTHTCTHTHRHTYTHRNTHTHRTYRNTWCKNVEKPWTPTPDCSREGFHVRASVRYIFIKLTGWRHRSSDSKRTTYSLMAYTATDHYPSQHRGARLTNPRRPTSTHTAGGWRSQKQVGG